MAYVSIYPYFGDGRRVLARRLDHRHARTAQHVIPAPIPMSFPSDNTALKPTFSNVEKQPALEGKGMFKRYRSNLIGWNPVRSRRWRRLIGQKPTT